MNGVNLLTLLALLGAVLYAVHLRGRIRTIEHDARRDALNAHVINQRLEQELSNLRRPVQSERIGKGIWSHEYSRALEDTLNLGRDPSLPRIRVTGLSEDRAARIDVRGSTEGYRQRIYGESGTPGVNGFREPPPLKASAADLPEPHEDDGLWDALNGRR